jgi:hypothetical protein
MRKTCGILLLSAMLPLGGMGIGPAQAGDGGGVAAGIVGGLAAGTLLGIAASGPADPTGTAMRAPGFIRACASANSQSARHKPV